MKVKVRALHDVFKICDDLFAQVENESTSYKLFRIAKFCQEENMWARNRLNNLLSRFVAIKEDEDGEKKPVSASGDNSRYGYEITDLEEFDKLDARRLDYEIDVPEAITLSLEELAQTDLSVQGTITLKPFIRG